MGKMYTKDHEWLLFDGEIVTVGITVYAQDALGDIVYVELPTVDNEAKRDVPLAVIESVKAASDVFAPVNGVVTEVNQSLQTAPETINASPEDRGWLFKIRTSERSDPAWMSKSAYDQYASTL